MYTHTIPSHDSTYFRIHSILEFSRRSTYYINTACSGFWVGAMIRVIVLLRNKYSTRSLVSLSLSLFFFRLALIVDLNIVVAWREIGLWSLPVCPFPPAKQHCVQMVFGFANRDSSRFKNIVSIDYRDRYIFLWIPFYPLLLHLLLFIRILFGTLFVFFLVQREWNKLWNPKVI